jgi:exonuclease VII small subunit
MEPAAVVGMVVAITSAVVAIASLIWRSASSMSAMREQVARLSADVERLNQSVKSLDDGKVSSKTLNERLHGLRRDMQQRLLIAQLGGTPPMNAQDEDR